MIKKLLLGLFLRCPNCGKGRISDGLFSIRKTCDVCNVIYERKPGESLGASAIWLVALPILALIQFFVLVAINDEWSMLILLGLPLAFVVIAGLGGYRHIRGLWIAIAYLTGGVYADDDLPSGQP